MSFVLIKGRNGAGSCVRPTVSGFCGHLLGLQLGIISEWCATFVASLKKKISSVTIAFDDLPKDNLLGNSFHTYIYSFLT